MQPFDIGLLFFPAVLILIITAVVGVYVTRSMVMSLFSAFIKSGVFLVYFGLFFDGTFTFLDDWGYVAGGESLLDEGVGLTNLAQNWEFALMTGGGDHFLYYLYNTYAFRLFGVGYYAPVALNIMLTVLIAWVGSVVGAREFGFSAQWKKIFFMFLLFHPDIFAWSNVMNGKDTLVLLMHVLLLLAASFHFEGRSRLAIALAAPVVIVLFFLRFYVPVFFAGALIVQYLLTVKGLKVQFKIASAAIVLAYALDSVIGHLIPQALSMLQEHSINPVVGFVHMALTPIPFNTDANYKFLDIPALLHWLMIPLVAYGVIALARRKKTSFTVFFMLYLVAFMGLYSINDELTGPRHRIQLDFAWAVLQFIGIKYVLRRMVSSKDDLLPANTTFARLHSR
jgi:hypothetical protein